MKFKNHNKSNTADRYAPADFFVECKDMKNRNIGPLDFLKVDRGDYIKELFIQLKKFLERPEKLRNWDQISKEDIGTWPLFFSLILIFIIMVLALLMVKLR